MLKYTQVEFELLPELPMYTFFEQFIRDGMTQCSHRYACYKRADINCTAPYAKRYMKNVGDSYQLMYWDANNLYGVALSEKLPKKKFSTGFCSGVPQRMERSL